MFVCMDAILYEEKGSPWGELSPVGRLRGVVLMHIFYFVEPLSVIAARCHPPQGAFSCPTGNSPCLPEERLCVRCFV